MPLTPGSAAIVGGTVLRIPAIQSPDYVPGVSGWIIRADGSAEFNTGTFRGSIEVGSLTGQHFWVNNPNTGDVIDVYNTANKLVFSIDATGRLVSVSSVSNAEIVMNGGTLFFENTAQSAIFPPNIVGSIGADLVQLELQAGEPANYTGSTFGSFIILNTGDTTASEYIAAGQRGVQGALLQNDQGNANQLIHCDNYSGTTDGSGHLLFNHGCSFTPVGAIFTGRAPAIGTFPNLTVGTDGFTATQANFTFIIANTNVFYANAAVMFSAIFFG